MKATLKGEDFEYSEISELILKMKEIGYIIGNNFKVGDGFKAGHGFTAGNNFKAGDGFVAGDEFIAGNWFTVGDRFVAGDEFIAGNWFTVGNGFLAGNRFVAGDGFKAGHGFTAGNNFKADFVMQLYFNNSYPYHCYISKSGEDKFLQMGCKYQKIEEWKENHWNNDVEFPNDGSIESNDRDFYICQAIKILDRL